MQVDRSVNPAVIDEKRTLQSSLQQMHTIQSETLEKDKAKLRTQYGIKEDFNPMLSIPADLYQ